MSELTLHWHEGNQHKSRNVAVGNELTIGRRSDCHIVIAEKTVSRRHGLIYSAEGQFMIRNLSQTNPIRLNDRELQHGDFASLKEADVIKIGPTSFEVSLALSEGAHKIRCINCNRILEYDPTGFCPWCGMALSAGTTVMDLE